METGNLIISVDEALSNTEIATTVPRDVLEDSPWVYRGRCVKVVDGDTYDILVDCGFSIYHRIRVRLRGVDTPEIFGPKACEAGRIAKQHVETSILDREVQVRTYKKTATSYNRWEADVYFKEEGGLTVNLAKFLVLNGYGVQVEGYNI